MSCRTCCGPSRSICGFGLRAALSRSSAQPSRSGSSAGRSCPASHGRVCASAGIFGPALWRAAVVDWRAGVRVRAGELGGEESAHQLAVVCRLAVHGLAVGRALDPQRAAGRRPREPRVRKEEGRRRRPCLLVDVEVHERGERRDRVRGRDRLDGNCRRVHADEPQVGQQRARLVAPGPAAARVDRCVQRQHPHLVAMQLDDAVERLVGERVVPCAAAREGRDVETVARLAHVEAGDAVGLAVEQRRHRLQPRRVGRADDHERDRDQQDRAQARPRERLTRVGDGDDEQHGAEADDRRGGRREDRAPGEAPREHRDGDDRCRDEDGEQDLERGSVIPHGHEHDRRHAGDRHGGKQLARAGREQQLLRQQRDDLVRGQVKSVEARPQHGAAGERRQRGDPRHSPRTA